MMRIIEYTTTSSEMSRFLGVERKSKGGEGGAGLIEKHLLLFALYSYYDYDIILISLLPIYPSNRPLCVPNNLLSIPPIPYVW